MLLLEEGIPSTLRRSAGFDVPDFLAAGPRDVMVPESGVAVAREVLQQSEIAATPAPGAPRAAGDDRRPALKLMLGLLLGSGVLGLVILLLVALNN